MVLILASTSPIRRTLLTNVGVAHEAVSPDADEEAAKALHKGDDKSLAITLAEAKALSVSRERRDPLVLGSDSLVSIDGRRFSKPRDKAEAAEHLRIFSGKTMVLTSAAALAHAGAVEWSHAEEARLQVRSLSGRFIADYLDRDWPAVSYCVGVFRLEGPGVQLFERIEGDHFTILGLPLLAVLAELRNRGLLTA